MIAIVLFVYFLVGLWSAERFRERGDISALTYLAAVFFWPAFWFVMSIEADVETKSEDDDEV